VAPEHKIRIVKAWQEKGDIVAMTGDGVNDAPALKAADIGIAMGITGTEVSKDAAKMILTDDNFATIVKAIESGRNVYNNIKNAIIYLLSGNLSAIITVVVTSLAFLPDPFTAVQLLFINLVTDSLPAIAIGMEPDHPDVINQKPRRSKESILNRDAITQIGVEGLLIFLAVMASYLIGLKTSASMATTMAFSTLTLSRLLHGFSQRGSKPIWELPFNKYSVYAFITGALLLAAILNIPTMQPIFDVTPMSILQAGLVVLFSLASFTAVQLFKVLSSRSH
ncbi:HAD-IC family P-type ATPase, partial [Faecalibaculum rodentium]